jgi:hypothetical protein
MRSQALSSESQLPSSAALSMNWCQGLSKNSREPKTAGVPKSRAHLVSAKQPGKNPQQPDPSNRGCVAIDTQLRQLPDRAAMVALRLGNKHESKTRSAATFFWTRGAVRFLTDQIKKSTSELVRKELGPSRLTLRWENR